MVTVALSVGGTKIGAGAVRPDGSLAVELDPVATPRGFEARVAAIVERVGRVMAAVDPVPVAGVGISYPECIPPPARVVADRTLLPAADDPVSTAIERALRGQLAMSVPIEVMHDAAAAALGETGAGGTLAGCRNCVFVVWGTGIASGIIHDGCLYWCDSVIGTMTGEIGNLVVRRRDGSWTYRPSRSWLTVAAPEATLDQWLCGPAITRRFRRQVADDPRRQALLAACGRPLDHLELPDVAAAAAGGDAFAAELIVGAGDEMGAALVPFVQYWKTGRGMPFADTIIIGSGVALLGELADSQGRSLLLTAVRARLAGECDPSGIILSRIGYERELMGFAGAFGGAT